MLPLRSDGPHQALTFAFNCPVQERVNADLMTYKGVLSKLEAAKEIMKASWCW